MAHTHSVIDDDLHFIIDPSTRDIGNGSKKVKLIQYDHNSEQFTFEIPRFVEGHDMSLCNSIRVNYININKSTREQHPGVYEVSNIQAEEDNIIFSWLVSRNATQYVGPLNFLIKFMCFDEGGYITYEWHTDIFKNASVSTGMNNEESIEEVYPDILEKWKSDVLAEEASRIVAESERVTAESERANTFAGYETEINQFKNEIVTGKDSATDNTRFAIGAAEQNLEVPSMEEFNQLKDEKLSEPTEGLAVGKYFRVAALDANGHAVLEAVDAKDVGVQDVQVAGASVVADGVANVPLANELGRAGVVKLSPAGGIKWSGNIDALSIDYASQDAIAARSSSNKPLIPYYLDYAVKAAMCDGKGAAWTADEQAAARERMGCYNGFTVLMDEVISEEAQNIYFVLPGNASEFIAYFESYNTAVSYTGSPYLVFDNVGSVNPVTKIYSYFGSTLNVDDMNIKGIQKCVIINDSDVCVEYASVSVNAETTNQIQVRSGRVGIAKRTSNKIGFHITGQSYPIGTRFLVLVRCK